MTSDIIRIASQILSSRLLTDDQIRSITSNVVGDYFSEWLASPKRERETADRVELARQHISEASAIISAIQSDLDAQAKQLDQTIKDLEAKKQDAERYAVLAQTNQEAFAAMRAEMERTVREQLQAHADKDKRLRRVVSFTLWSFTLVAGAALGAYFIPLVALLRKWLGM